MVVQDTGMTEAFKPEHIGVGYKLASAVDAYALEVGLAPVQAAEAACRQAAAASRGAQCAGDADRLEAVCGRAEGGRGDGTTE